MSDIQMLYNMVVKHQEMELKWASEFNSPILQAIHSARVLAYSIVLVDIENLFLGVDTSGKNR